MINFIIFHVLSSLFFLNIFNFTITPFSYGEVLKVWETKSFSQKFDTLNDLDLSASSVVVFDLDSDNFIFNKDSEEPLPIASISKLMSAIVLMDIDIDFENYYKIRGEDHRAGGRDYLFLGEEVKNRDLLALSLIASDNTALISLISSIGLDENIFVSMMNEKARSMDLKKTFFVDATGLNNGNIATAREVAIISKEAFNIPFIYSLVTNYEYKFNTKNGRIKSIVSTNELLNGFGNSSFSSSVIAGKTGYNISAGYCLSLLFELEDKNRFISVVLGSRNIKSRFFDSEKIIKEIENIYK